ncbi:MAG: transcriptional repressor [Atopobiaceae bacterium]|nr:transcriptional repressor [Atopobiaceae bacterium]
MRKSSQRDAVWEWIRDRHDHPSVEEVCQGVRQTLPGIGLATVYRNLAALEEQGKVRSVSIDGGPVRYDPIVGDHAHFNCVRCGRVYDLMDFEVELANAGSTFAEVGRIDSYDMCLHGVCQACVDSEQ